MASVDLQQSPFDHINFEIYKSCGNVKKFWTYSTIRSGFGSAWDAFCSSFNSISQSHPIIACVFPLSLCFGHQRLLMLIAPLGKEFLLLYVFQQKSFRTRHYSSECPFFLWYGYYFGSFRFPTEKRNSTFDKWITLSLIHHSKRVLYFAMKVEGLGRGWFLFAVWYLL